ncbi:MAG: hypothetical protein ACREFO_16160 [Acetobacteraceae bacterium]
MIVGRARDRLATGAAAWRNTANLVRHRQLIVPTRSGAEVVLLTRVRLTGETETCVLRSWLDGTTAGDVETKAKQHFETVAAAVGASSAALGLVRFASLFAGIGGAIAAAVQAIRGLLAHGPASLPQIAATNGPLLAGLAFLLIGLALRPILRRWLRALIRRVPLGVPLPS